MPLFTDTQEFDGRDQTLFVTVQVGTGNLTIESLLDAETGTWVLADTITADGVYEVNFNVEKVRFTPSNDAKYSMSIRK